MYPIWQDKGCIKAVVYEFENSISIFKGAKWFQVAGEHVEDDCRKERQSMFNTSPSLKKMCFIDDGNTEIFCFMDATAQFSSFTHKPEEVKF